MRVYNDKWLVIIVKREQIQWWMFLARIACYSNYMIEIIVFNPIQHTPCDINFHPILCEIKLKKMRKERNEKMSLAHGFYICNWMDSCESWHGIERVHMTGTFYGWEFSKKKKLMKMRKRKMGLRGICRWPRATGQRFGISEMGYIYSLLRNW